MPGLNELLSKIFRPQAGQMARTPGFVPEGVGRDIGKRGNGVPDDILQRLPEAYIGSPARTPGFVPESVGRDIGAKMGGTFARDAAVPSPEAMTPPRYVPAAPTAPVEAATAIATPRIASPAMESSINIAAPDRGLERSRQEALRSGDPIAQKRYEYVTEDGMPKRTWKDALKNIGLGALQGAANGNGLGGALGGAITGGVIGAASPRMGREYQFNSMQLPRLLQDQQRQQGQAYNQAQIGRLGAQAQRDNAQTKIAQRNADLAERKQTFEEGQSKFGTPQMVVGADGQEHLIVYDTRNPNQKIDLGVAGTPHAQLKLAEYNREQAAKLEAERIKARATEGDANRKSRERVASSSQAVQVYKHNNPNRAEKDVDGGKLMSVWAKKRAEALDEAKTQEQRDAALVESNAAAEKLKGNPNFEVSGNGGWAYVKPRQGQSSGQPKGEVDIEGYVKAAEAKGKTREQALQFLRSQGHIR